MDKVVILGASGFVGKNLVKFLSHFFNVIETTRNVSDSQKGECLFFDLHHESSWSSVSEVAPAYIINCIGYGVVREETGIELTYEVNYFQTIRFYQYLAERKFQGLLIHIGSAFEYDLNTSFITEKSLTLTASHYGISKLMASEYLLHKGSLPNFIILRCFNMFGPFESESKLIPSLILSQKKKEVLPLSSGTQRRDYMYIKDLSMFLFNILSNRTQLYPNLMNVGSGVSRSVFEIAQILYDLLPYKSKQFWNWGALNQRSNEGTAFSNASKMSMENGLNISDLPVGLQETINYYWAHEL